MPTPDNREFAGQADVASDDISIGELLSVLAGHTEKPLLFSYGGRMVKPGYHVTEVKAGSFAALGERVTSQLLLVMLLGGLGVALVANVYGGLSDLSTPLGILLLLGAVLCCAFYTVFSRKLVERVGSVFTVRHAPVLDAARPSWGYLFQTAI